MLEGTLYCFFGGEAIWYMSEDDAISDLTDAEPGSHHYILGVTAKYAPDTGYMGDIALTSVLEYIVPGVG